MMGPGNGDDLQRRRGDEEPSVPSTPPLEPFRRGENSPLNISISDQTTSTNVEATDQAPSPQSDVVINEIFPICCNISTRLILDDGMPIVVLEDGVEPLERYPLRYWQDGDPKSRATFKTEMATVSVDWSGTSIEIDVKPSGMDAFFARWVPGLESHDTWQAIDREPRDPNEITIVRPGEQNNDKVMLFKE